MGKEASRDRVNPAVYTLGGVMALALIGDSLLYSVLPIYAEQLGIPLVMVGAVLSINRWVRLLANPYAVMVYCRHPVSVPLAFSTAGSVLSTAMYAFPLGTLSFLLARIIWGFSYSFFRLGSYLVVLETSRPVLGLAMGITQAVSRVGSAITVVAGGVLIDFLGYQAGMLVLAALSALAFPLLLLLRSQLKHGTGDDVHAVEEKPSAERAEALSVNYCLAAGFITCVVGNGLVSSSLSLVVQQRVGDAVSFGGITLGIATIAGLVFSSRWITGMVVGPIAGHLGDKFGRRLPFVMVTTLQGTAMLILALWAAPLVTVVCTVLFFVFLNAQRVLLDTALGDSTRGAQEGQIIGRYNSLQDLGAAVGPVLGYWVGATVGFELVYAAAACLLIALGIGAHPLTGERRDQKSSSQT
ncbi:MAG: MFS transporter [Limnochordia bacterium]|jgi:DHA1 family multidrug resistance protein-like MFS transporter